MGAKSSDRLFGRKVLLVEDEETVCEILSEALSPQVALFDIAHNGFEAIDLILRSDYDVILLDVSMPRMDGLSFFKYLRELKPHLLSRVIFITGDTETHKVRSFISENKCAYLDKPFAIADLRDAIAMVSSLVGTA